jgi:hypothetical protein
VKYIVVPLPENLKVFHHENTLLTKSVDDIMHAIKEVVVNSMAKLLKRVCAPLGVLY